MPGKYYVLVMITSIAIWGCQSNQKSSSIQDISPQQAHLKMTCHVNFYQEDSLYVTEQEHLFTPASKSLQISSKEPSGRYTWSLQGEQYSVKNVSGNKTFENLYNKAYLQAIYYGMMSSAQWLPLEQARQEEPVRIEGKWYIPYLLTKKDATIRLMKNQFNDRFEQVIVQKDNQIYQVLCYNLRFVNELNHNLPRTIDIFDATDGLSSKKLRVKVQYHTTEVTP
ncbi:hypothetical protein ACQ9LF_06075 [Anaerohalosphaeraceae bacterium U12dextr]|jgi:hypothetical protein